MKEMTVFYKQKEKACSGYLLATTNIYLLHF